MAVVYAKRCHPECPFDDCLILVNPPEEEEQSQGQGEGGEEDDSDTTNNSTSDGGGSQENSSDSEEESGDSGGTDSDGQQQEESSSEQSEQSQQSQSKKAKPKPRKSQKPKEQQQQPKPEKKPKKKPELKKIKVDKPVQYIYEALPDNYSQKGGGAGLGNIGIADLGRHQHREKIITDSVFYARLRNVLLDNAYDRAVRGRKRGHLDMRSLYKVPMKAENIFTLKEARKNKHYNVILLIDQSGSMYDGKINVAADVAAFLARSLERVGVNYAVIGYSDDFLYHKKFDQTATDDYLKKMKYNILHTGGGGTRLLPSLKESFGSLKRMEGKNIIISVNDGGPSSIDQCIQFIKGNAHNVDYIDVGINYRPIMSSGIQINNVQELKPLLIKQLQKRIKRG